MKLHLQYKIIWPQKIENAGKKLLILHNFAKIGYNNSFIDVFVGFNEVVIHLQTN